ncbi:uncharacterized protein [Ptychodera flava]|uniref:uncharacterized protein n=1 Tax=Ptychodera flava TaxID=63121 RepID=UPI00396AB12D
MQSPTVNDPPSSEAQDARRSRSARQYSESEIPPNMPDSLFMYLGGAHFISAAMSMILGVFSMLIQSYGFWIGTAVWTGIAFFITGCLGYGVGHNRKNKYMVIGFIVMSVVSMIFAIILLIDSSLALAKLGDPYTCGSDESVKDCSENPTALLTVNILLIITATIEAGFSITSVVTSGFAVKWDKNRADMLQDGQVYYIPDSEISRSRESSLNCQQVIVPSLPNYHEALRFSTRRRSSDLQSLSGINTPLTPAVDRDSLRRYRLYQDTQSASNREMVELSVGNLSNVTSLTQRSNSSGQISLQGLENHNTIDILQGERTSAQRSHMQSLPDLTPRVTGDESELAAMHTRLPPGLIAYPYYRRASDMNLPYSHDSIEETPEEDDNDSVSDVTLRIVHEAISPETLQNAESPRQQQPSERVPIHPGSSVQLQSNLQDGSRRTFTFVRTPKWGPNVGLDQDESRGPTDPLELNVPAQSVRLETDPGEDTCNVDSGNHGRIHGDRTPHRTRAQDENDFEERAIERNPRPFPSGEEPITVHVDMERGEQGRRKSQDATSGCDGRNLNSEGQEPFKVPDEPRASKESSPTIDRTVVGHRTHSHRSRTSPDSSSCEGASQRRRAKPGTRRHSKREKAEDSRCEDGREDALMSGDQFEVPTSQEQPSEQMQAESSFASMYNNAFYNIDEWTNEINV